MVDVLFAVVDSLKQFLEDIVNDQAPLIQIDALVLKVNNLLTWKASVEEMFIPQLPPLDSSARSLIKEGLAAGQNVVVIYAEADPKGVAPLARLLQVYIGVEQAGGQVVASMPTLDEIERGKGPHTLIAVALVDLTPAMLQEDLAMVADLRSVQVADLSNANDILAAGDSTPQPVEEERFLWQGGEETPAVESLTSAEDEYPLPATTGNRRQSSGRTVRTSIERLDNLMNLAGELVTDRNRLFKIYEDLSQTLSEEHLQTLNDTIAHLSTITDQLHDEVVKARMQPIEYVFNKFPRLVRQISQELGKQVDLILSGQDTEVDRSVIEQISDPLLHLVRNAIDHGIETAEVRQRNGKPAAGRLELNARSEEGQIIITISDDGRGIDAEKVKQKAVAMGLISREQAATLSYAEAVDLVFSPGLSTATEVSDLSGRGVGTDVVRNNIQRINGSVIVYSTPNLGTTFELRLPLTLAIIPTLLVEVQGQVFALPLQNVLEIFKLEPTSVSTVRGREAAYVRGEILTLFRLSHIFGDAHRKLALPDEGGDPQAGEFVISLNHRDTQFGVVVDRLLGKQDVVIKSLGYPINNIRGLSGATLLGDGRIGLIADVSALVAMSHSQSQAAIPAV
jgi:two-component system chemotaxis sensor kinase CheA